MATQIVQSKADTYVAFNSPSGNFSSLSYMYVHRVVTSTAALLAFLQFDIPVLSNKQITKAELKIHCTQKGRHSTIAAAQYAIPVSVNTLTGGTVQSQYIDSDLAYSPTEITSPVYVESANEWIVWDITAIVTNGQGTNDAVFGLSDLTATQSDDTEIWKFSSRESSNIPYIEITYNDAVPDLPTILYPNGDVIEKGNALTFQWKHNSLYDTGQVKYDFGWRQQGNASWTDALGVVTTTQSRTVDTNALPTGIIEWRVRTYNANNAVSEYAYGSFELTGRPTAPIIDTMKNDAITEIAWRSNASETAIFRIWIYQGATLIHDSGNMPGGLKSSYVPNMMFPNGQYTVKMRIGSVYGVFSDESAKVFTISASVPNTPDMKLSVTHGGILITTTSTAADKIVYRSEDDITFIPIGRFSGSEYTDYAVKSDVMYEYYIRAHNGSYADSGKQSIKVKYKGALLSEINTPGDYIEIYKSDSDWYNSIKSKFSNEAELVKYEGRAYPVKESGIHKETGVSTSFYLSNANAEKIGLLYDKNGIYLFRNSEMCFSCEINELSYENTLFNAGKNVEISLSQIDYSLEVRFDV
ncbi:hypothetical protein DS742_11835 [Lacrimispora amygdalina]|uniref:Carbohydrate-binding module family 96 domain-containing protein n=1 Tax=Lacrimispora amygdalina TaxID=253257 RepID=A0A3E2NCV1_9FIRM|nr:DNRLRE domain-containing protein [Clostridium indicum]RFZ78794.1 hypothetical protein DS742_11835 [Clostridium indicum]